VSFAGAGVLIMLAPMIKLIPVEIAKNDAIEGISRMRGRGLEDIIPHGPDLAKKLSLSFTKLAGS
jgi:hypothetical protein